MALQDTLANLFAGVQIIAARKVKGGDYIKLDSGADFGINFTVIMRCRESVDPYLIKHELIRRLHERYRAEGIEISFPIRTIHMRNTENISS